MNLILYLKLYFSIFLYSCETVWRRLVSRGKLQSQAKEVKLPLSPTQFWLLSGGRGRKRFSLSWIVEKLVTFYRNTMPLRNTCSVSAKFAGTKDFVSRCVFKVYIVWMWKATFCYCNILSVSCIKTQSLITKLARKIYFSKITVCITLFILRGHYG